MLCSEGLGPRGSTGTDGVRYQTRKHQQCSGLVSGCPSDRCQHPNYASPRSSLFFLLCRSAPRRFDCSPGPTAHLKPDFHGLGNPGIRASALGGTLGATAGWWRLATTTALAGRPQCRYPRRKRSSTHSTELAERLCEEQSTRRSACAVEGCSIQRGLRRLGVDMEGICQPPVPQIIPRSVMRLCVDFISIVAVGETSSTYLKPSVAPHNEGSGRRSSQPSSQSHPKRA